MKKDVCVFNEEIQCFHPRQRGTIGCCSWGWCIYYKVPEKKYHGHPMFYQIIDELKDLHSRKNADYADEEPLRNLRMCEAGGIAAWKGIVIRLTDKISRLLTFVKKESYEVKDESVEDTLRDLAVYAVLGIILYRERASLTHDNPAKN